MFGPTIDMRFIDLTGQVFGELTVVSSVGFTTSGNARWLCLCSCGNETVVASSELRKGTTKGCGHLKGKGNLHGMFGTRTYNSWCAMQQRCRTPKAPGFHNYGGRGITVCREWQDFTAFLVDMGERPEGTSLDRIDNDGNYEPGNCKWSTPQEQRMNQRPRRKRVP